MSKPTNKNTASNGKGRPKGSLNKRNVAFFAVLEKHNFCPASAIIEIYEEAKKTYDNYGVIYDAISEAKAEKEGYAAPVQDNAHVYLKIALDAAKELSSYSYAKRKAIETNVDPAFLEAYEALKDKSDSDLRALLKGVASS